MKNTYYIVDEVGVLHTLTEVEPNPLVSTLLVTSDQDETKRVIRYSLSQVFMHKKGALCDYLKRKELELQFENLNIARAKDRIENIRDKICQLNIKINSLN